MNNKLILEYKTSDNGFDLVILGESFIGFNKVFQEYFEISGINGDLEIRTEKITSGSVIVTLLTNVVTSGIPFHNVKDLLDFLQLIDQNLFAQATAFFNDIQNVHKSVNDFFAVYPADGNLIMFLVPIFFTKMWDITKHQKGSPKTVTPDGKRIPSRYATRLHQMIVSKKFKKVVKPIVDDQASYIALAANNNESIVNQTNFEEYLPEEEKVLSDLENGNIYKFTGEVLALQNTKGDTLKIKIHDIDPRYQLLVAYPEDGKDTSYYKEYYKKSVNITAEIYRKSLYKRPELIIKSIGLLQTELL